MFTLFTNFLQILSTGTIIIGVIAFFALLLSLYYRRCPSNKVLVVYGKIMGKTSAKTYHGGGTFVWPLIQSYSYLDLTPRTIHIPLKHALSLQNIRINVPSTFVIAISTASELMQNAAVRLLNLSMGEIESMASEIIIGQLRLIVASLTIEQINQDREKFLEAITTHIDHELSKLGLILINVNITDIQDEAGYINSIGKKAASTALNQAKIDVAEQEKRGEIGQASAEQEQRTRVSQYHAQAVEGENIAQATIAESKALLAQKKAEAEKLGEIAQQVAQAQIQEAKKIAEERRLEAEQIVPRKIEQQKTVIDAQALAQKTQVEAQGQAEAILTLKKAEAAGIEAVLEAKAQGYRKIIEACGNSKDASSLLLVEKLEQIVQLQTEAIKNIKIDKITVWDSGSSEKGSSTAQFMSNMVKSLPALHEIANMAGVELPEYLGTAVSDTDKEKTTNK